MNPVVPEPSPPPRNGPSNGKSAGSGTRATAPVAPDRAADVVDVVARIDADIAENDAANAFAPVPSLPPALSDAPVMLAARKNGVMSQSNAQADPVQHAQPTVGSITGHRPHTVSAAVSDLEPDIDADLDGYEEEEYDGEKLPQGRFLDRERSWLAFNERVLELAEDPHTPSSNGRTSWRSSPAISTSSSWSGWPA